MKVAVRADGGARVGLGHLGRCVAIAQALQARGATVRFVEADPECLSWLSERGMRCARLGSSRWDAMVADSYRFTPADWNRFRRAAPHILAIDDFGTLAEPCRWILNGLAHAPTLHFSAPAGTSLLLGPSFQPLRREYWAAPGPKPVRPHVRRFLVSLGGGERGGLTARLVEALRRAVPDVEVLAVIGPFSRESAAARRGVSYIKSPRSLRPLLEETDLVVCGGGQTPYEAANIGVPAVVMDLGPDQSRNSEALQEAGCSARVRPGTDAVARAARTARRLALSPALRTSMRDSGRAMMDGRGALRVADVMTARLP